jgi:PAS domain S-box-containing protein
MSGALQEKLRELQNLNETLEHRIEERTQELSQSAEQLQRQHQQGQLLAEITLKIRQSLELEEILQTAVIEVQQLLQADRALIFQLKSEEWGTVVQEAVAPGFPTILGRELSDPCWQEGYLDLYRQGRIVATADLEAPESEACQLEWLTQFGVKANLAVPVLIRDRLWGLLITHQCTHPRQWKDLEIELVQQLADQIAIAISQAQLLEHLEELVAERTAELTQTNQQLQQEINDRLQAEQALRHSEEQLRLITDALPVLISYVDAQQHYRFNNRAYEDWLGQSRTEISGRHIQEVLGEAAYQQIRGHVGAALSGQQVTFEQEIPYKGGSPRWVSATYIPHVGKRGEVKGFFASIADISERKAMERMKDELISVVSHELRTPLTSIHGSLKLLATGRLGHLSAEGQQMLQIADENTDRLVRLVNDVLDLQRMESGLVNLDQQACDAAGLIRRAAGAMQGLAQQNGITLAINPDSIAVWADPDYIIQTLTNLIGNAIKFSPPGSTVSLAAQLKESDAAEALFQVRDRGRGIPADKLESIFGRFQQVDASDSRSKGGTGLGLAICRRIVERHGGKIWADSVLGEGSTFYFTLPRFRGQEN